MYRLSANLVGHEEDVKALTFIGNEIHSVSRDSRLRQWLRTDGNSWKGKTLYKGTRYLNAVASNPSDHAAIISGQDSQILVVDTDRAEGDREEPRLFLLGHESNVCALDVDGGSGLVLSGSWDKTARLWQNGQSIAVLKHSAAVWAVLILNDSIVTASADQLIRQWSKKGEALRAFEGHTDAVRGLAKIDENTFASCSNDGTVRVWGSGNTKVLSGHTSFVYSVDYIKSKNWLVSSGEDRSVRVWDLNKNGECIQVITLPAISLWSVKVDGSTGDFAVGGSDCIVRVFSTDVSKKASAEEIKTLEESIANSSLGEDQVSEVKEDQIVDASVLKTPGKQEGAVVMVKSAVGAIEAHQWSSGSWIKIGEVVGKSSTGGAGSSNRTASYEGQLYDYVFDVDVEDGKPPLKLPYNNTDNPYQAADKFLATYELPSSYREEVVRFILTNAQPIEIGSSAPAKQSQSTSAAPVAPIPAQIRILPQDSFIRLVNYKAAPILKQVFTINEQESAKLSAEDLDTLKRGLEDGITQNNATDLLKVAVFMTQNWAPANILAALDIIRIIVPHLNPLPTAVILQQIFSTLDSDAPKHALLSLRALVNLFNIPAGQKLVISSQVEEHGLNVIRELAEGAPEVRTANMQVAIASLLLNYSILIKTDPDKALGLLNIVSVCLTFTDQEAIYRLLLAAGTVIVNCRTEEIKQAFQAFELNKLLEKGEGASEQRFTELVREIKLVIG